MALSSDLISQFVKTTKDTTTTKKETIVYGEVVQTPGDDGVGYVKLDGAENSTPVTTTTKLNDGNRVIVMIKNHHAVVTGNTTAMSGTDEDVRSAEAAILNRATIDQLNAAVANVDRLKADAAEVAKLKVDVADIDHLKANKVDVESLSAEVADIVNLKVDSAHVKNLDARYANLTEFTSIKGEIKVLDTDYAEFKKAVSENLESSNATIESLNTTYANIDFSNIGKAAMEYFYAASGLIDNVTVGDGTISGMLVGVTIKGDSIEGNTIVADKLVIRGEDGLYYKLNTDGMVTEAEQTEYNSLNGSVIAAKSITATKISVSDLVAFDATIGGFTITEDSIYSEVKDSEGNTTRGIHLSADGQVNFGDETNFIKYYRDDDGTYKLAISAASILYALNGKQYSIADLGSIGEYVHIGTYEDEPCIELGELDSDFRLVITNTRIMFMEGSSVPAYINNQSLHITKAVIEEEIQQGEFVWKVRANGNLGLMWKGATS